MSCGKKLIEEVLCPGCGKPVAKDAKFCGECGYKLIKSCPNCGKEVGSGKFCPDCGTAL
jgi:predicted amidophosphoribosyltransferase